MPDLTLRTLKELFYEFPGEVMGDAVQDDTLITGIVYDSRAAKTGSLFVALTGSNTDGHKYIPAAIEKGAAAVVGSQKMESLPVPYLRVKDTRFALAHLSAAFYRHPARQMTVVGITGTDGKTTTTNLLFNILLSAGLQAGMISTVNAVIGDEVIDTGFHVTTPEAPEVQHYLARMRAAGLTHVVLETTSHGLAQDRVTGCEFDIGVVTNITHEHLDYHGSYEAYRKAKGRLFAGLVQTMTKPGGNPRLAVLNLDDQSYSYLDGLVSGSKITYSIENPAADVYAEQISHSPSGLTFTARLGTRGFPVHSQMIGKHNISNCLAAIGAAHFGLNLPEGALQHGIESLQSVPGRMELVDCGQDFTAIVDFAHTPNALRRALEAARGLTAGRVLVVYGSAGLRDRQKRRMMPEISLRLADVSFLTAEDPRSESLTDILAEMSTAARQAGGVEGKTFICVPDRGEAIRSAVRAARAGDVVIACGKGHEQSMCFGDIEFPWDDRTAMRSALAELLGRPGPQMPYLPTQG